MKVVNDQVKNERLENVETNYNQQAQWTVL